MNQLDGSACQISRVPHSAPGPPFVTLPKWLTYPKRKLEQFLKYGHKVYDVLPRLARVRDGRRRPQIPTADVIRALFFTAVLRLPSLNALEGELKRTPWQRLLGGRAQPGHKRFSADTVARVLDSLELDKLRQILHTLIQQAERKKVFRDGPARAQRCVALDGWEPFSSYDRHCSDCLTRTVLRGTHHVTQYYHQFVVAFLLGENAELVLDLEPLRTADLRRQSGETTDRHDGEQTAALRLIDRLHATFGSWIDLFVLDALYPNGPVMTRLTERGYGAVITIKKETDEPFKEALNLMRGQPPAKTWENFERREQIRAWDIDEIETLETFKGKVRVVRVEVSRTRGGTTHLWCAAVVGQRARQLRVQTVHRIQRSRWHEENTAFNQWTQLWHLTHVYRHTPRAVVALLLLWLLAFNLMQLFVYRRLRRPRVPRDPCDTIRALVAQMAQELATLRAAVPWAALLDSS